MASFDIVIKDGMIFDGRRNPRYRGDLGIKDGTIVEIGNLRSSDGARGETGATPGQLLRHGGAARQPRR